MSSWGSVDSVSCSPDIKDEQPGLQQDRLGVLLCGHNTASPACQFGRQQAPQGLLAPRPAVPPHALQLHAKLTAHVLPEPTATRAEALGNQLLVDALAMPGRKLKAINNNQHQQTSAQTSKGKG